VSPGKIDRLNADNLRTSLGRCTIGREIVVLDKTTSTNDVVFQMALGASPEGLVVFAEHQTAGRGQHGNKWESPARKGLWFSILLRPKIEIRDSPRLAQWAANIIAATIQNEFSLPATVKLPNDVYINERKIAGVLVEMRAQLRGAYIAILGVGVNVNQMPRHFSKELRQRATSLAILRSSPVDRQAVAVALLRNLDSTYRDLRGL
jgi:BirA family transcriptional regulator, biotin operon repressor / biotin---[acetyl-CoA-carboxylase] ligase